MRNYEQKLLTTTALVFIIGIIYFISNQETKTPISDSVRGDVDIAQTALAAKFDYLSQNGNSSCSASFKESIPSPAAGDHLRGSCCSSINLHRYTEQVESLQKL